MRIPIRAVVGPSDVGFEEKWKPLLIDLTDNFSLHKTTGKMDAFRKVSEWCLESDQLLIFVVGGDGMMNEAVNGVVSSQNRNAILFNIPSGTANDFFCSFYGRIKFKERLRTLLQIDWPKMQTNDDLATLCIEVPVARVEYRTNDDEWKSRYFLNIASCGFSAAVVKRLEGKVKIGKLSYLWNSFLQFFHKRQFEFELRVDDCVKSLCSTASNSWFLIAVGLGRQFGGGMEVCPQERRQNNLKITIVEYAGVLGVLKLLFRLVRRKIQNCNFIQLSNGQVNEITSNDCLDFELDGELISGTQFLISLHGTVKLLRLE